MTASVLCLDRIDRGEVGGNSLSSDVGITRGIQRNSGHQVGLASAQARRVLERRACRIEFCYEDVAGTGLEGARGCRLVGRIGPACYVGTTDGVDGDAHARVILASRNER